MKSLSCLLMISLLNLDQKLEAQGYHDPVAAPEAMVVFGKARFTVLTDRLIRMEYSDDAAFTDQASLVVVNRHLTVPDFVVDTSDMQWLRIRTKFLELSYKRNGNGFSRNNLRISYRDSSQAFDWHYGKRNRGNLKGTTRTLDMVSGRFMLNKMRFLRLEDGILSKKGWTIIDDGNKPVFDQSDWPWVQARANKGKDLYFFGYGRDYKAALYDYTLIAGKIPMPPKFAFGVWYSKYWNYTDEELKDIVLQYRHHDFPLDVLVIDMDWHLTEKSSPEVFSGFDRKLNGWTGYTWEKKYFPDPESFLDWTNRMNIQTCLNLHPAEGVQPHESQYLEFAKAMQVDTNGKPTIPFDITSKSFAGNYFKILLHPLEQSGVDFWWLDWQQWSHTAIKGVNPTFYLNHLHFTDQQRQQKRAMVFHRWGGLGNHRYPIGFSGDALINWRSLRYQPRFTSTAANVGFSYWSHDIGGHMGILPKKKKDPELFTRWVQWGAFSPIFRTHATKDPVLERRLFQYPEPYVSAIRSAVELRYELIPYIYTCARHTYDSSVSFIHPMYYQNPELKKAYSQPRQYFFGTQMIAAPKLRKTGVKPFKQEVWLPPGDWYNFHTNTMLAGNTQVRETFAFDQVPLYVKAGSIIPTQTHKLNMSESVYDTIFLTVYPDRKGNAFGSLYEDDGKTEDYRKGLYARTAFHHSTDGDSIQFQILPDGNQFPGRPASRVYCLRLLHTQVNQVVSDKEGVAQRLEKDPNSGITKVWLGNVDTLQDILITCYP